MINLPLESKVKSNDHSISNRDLGYQHLFAISPINTGLGSRIKVSRRAVSKGELIKMDIKKIKM